MSIKDRPDLEAIVYPDCDGQPMADNTLQFEWIHTLKYGFENLYKNDPDVFVAGDLLWYPVEGDPTCRCAPDVLIAFGRPKGYRGSYMQWKEEGIAPRVVFEVLSLGNRADNMTRKRHFYERHGVEEYYIYDPDRLEFYGWMRQDGRLIPTPNTKAWTSPRLATRFEVGPEGLRVTASDGSRFRSYLDVVDGEELERQRADFESRRADQEKQRADSERLRADAERQRADQLAARLRELGVDLDAI